MPPSTQANSYKQAQVHFKTVAPVPAQKLSSALVRPIYLALGLTCVAVGVVNIFIPLMPTTIFLIVAVWAFKRSSPPLENWLLNHRVFGPTLRDWEETRSIRRRTKAIAIVSLWLCLAISAFLTHKPHVWAILAVIGIAVSAYIATRKTKPE